MAFTESVLAYTTRIEKLLVDLGGKGNGMIEKAKSLPNLPGPLLVDLRKIASVRNRLVHDHDYRFAGKEELFFGLCERAVANLTRLLPRTESLPRNPALDHQGSILSAPTSATRPPSVDEAFRREFVSRERPSEEGSQKANASAGSWGADNSKPPNATGAPTGSTNDQDATASNIVYWGLSLAAGVASWKILPHFCVRTVETGFWPIKSSHQEILWELVLLLSIAIGVGTYFLVRHLDKKER